MVVGHRAYLLLLIVGGDPMAACGKLS